MQREQERQKAASPLILKSQRKSADLNYASGQRNFDQISS